MSKLKKLRDLKAGDKFYFSFIGFREGDELICYSSSKGGRITVDAEKKARLIPTAFVTTVTTITLKGQKYWWGDDLDKDIEVTGSVLE